MKDIISLLVSFLLTVLIMPSTIKYFRYRQLGQTTLEIGPSWHKEKDGTPTMGGVVFLLVTVAVYLLRSFFAGGVTVSGFLILLLLISFGAIGFIDDFIILFMKRNEGLTSGQKFLAQIIAALIFVFAFQYLGLSNSLSLPFIGTVSSVPLYTLFGVFWIVGFSNAVNLTDGIDGLSSSTSLVALAFYAYIAHQQGQGDVFSFILILMGALFGFLLFNKKPARIFMGDVGSLAIGAIFAGLSMLLKVEWSLLLIGAVFVIETLSVILQVLSFKLTGKRIFKMSPIHHHFEMIGWSEGQIVRRFSLFGALMGFLAVLVL